MGLDISLVQISAFRSYVYGQPGSGNVPMISVSQIYPLREVEEFTISPERQLAKEMAESKRRVQDASTVRRLVTTESVADGTIFTLSPPQRPQLRHAQPARGVAATRTRPGARRTGRTTSTRRWSGTSTRRPTRRPAWSATSSSRPPASVGNFFGTQWWRDPTGWTHGRAGRARSAAARARCTASTGRAGSTRSASATRTGPRCRPCRRRTSSRCPRPIRGTHYGLSFAAGGRLRSDFYIDLGSPEASAAQFEVLAGAAGPGRVGLRRAAVVGAPARPRRLPRSPTTARATSPRSRTTPSTSTG